MVIQMRIDERLTHGQVCSTWINTLGATHVIVANDQVANDEFQKNILGMGIPSHVKCIFTTLEKSTELLNSPKSEGLKIFLVTQTPKDALYLVENAKGINEVNIANYGSVIKTGKKAVVNCGRAVLLDEDDVQYMREIKVKVKSVYHLDIVGTKKVNVNL